MLFDLIYLAREYNFIIFYFSAGLKAKRGTKQFLAISPPQGVYTLDFTKYFTKFWLLFVFFKQN